MKFNPPNVQIRVPKTAEIVAERIRSAIIRGELNDGDLLPPEGQMVEDFEVSRPTVREAIRILETENLIIVERGARGGPRVRRPSYGLVARAAGILLQAEGATLGDLYEMRMVIEPSAAWLIADRNRAEGVPLLQAELQRSRDSSIEDGGFLGSVLAFRTLLVEQSGNPALLMTHHAIQGLVEKHQRIAKHRKAQAGNEHLTYKLRDVVLSAHGQLLDLIAAGKGPAAYAMWVSYLKETREMWLSGLPASQRVDLLE